MSKEQTIKPMNRQTNQMNSFQKKYKKTNKYRKNVQHP